MTDRAFFLREWREYRQLSIQELAVATQFTTKCIIDLENGRMSYTERILTTLSEVFDCEPWRIIQDTPTKTDSNQLAQLLRDICTEATITYSDMGRLNELMEHREFEAVWVLVSTHLLETLDRLGHRPSSQGENLFFAHSRKSR